MANEVAQLVNVEQDKLRGEVEKLKRLLPLLIENNALLAKMQRAKFVAYVDEGFTAEQALILCKG